jgi:hypothetical protein
VVIQEVGVAQAIGPGSETDIDRSRVSPFRSRRGLSREQFRGSIEAVATRFIDKASTADEARSHIQSLSDAQPSHELFIPSLLPARLQKAALSSHLMNKRMKII